MVALRKESVDRNMLSWSFPVAVGVALRKESVDRNKHITETMKQMTGSLSARRAWIEISTVIVILRKRNSRSPQGERG